MINLTEQLFNDLNDKNHILGVFVDLRKAFDTVNHLILLRKLEEIGIRGVSLEFFRSYLSNRQQFVHLNGIDSSLKKISIGVPQGSILGPILFLIYINDLPDISSNLNFTLFADDTTVTLSGEDLPSLTSQVNNELNLLNDWAIQNRLTINTDKTEYILFSNRLANIDDIQLKIGQDKLTLTTNYKFLGIDLDNKLKFNNHIKSVVSKVAKSNGILYRIRKFLSIEARIHFYYAFVYPYLSYNVSIWGNSDEITLKPLIIAQKRVIMEVYR